MHCQMYVLVRVYSTNSCSLFFVCLISCLLLFSPALFNCVFSYCTRTGGVALFAGCSEAFLREVVLNLEPQVCIPGEYIVNKNDVARAMFFITRGEVEVLDNFEGKHLAFLHAPQYFGETAILEARRRTASIQALTYADLYYLLAASMQVILKSFKEDDERIHMNALQFLNHGLKKNAGKGLLTVGKRKGCFVFFLVQ